MRVLVVGGAGYIGSHVCKALAARGDEPVVFDNLSSGHEYAVRFGPFIRGDVRNPGEIGLALQTARPGAVMHFAANIEVGQGEAAPLDFWHNNVGGVIALLQAMQAQNCRRMVFSSTCATYGVPASLPITEDEPQTPINVYGRTKLAAETFLRDLSRAGQLDVAILRYFNAAGASADGEIGEDHDPETHLIPNILRSAAGLAGPLKIFGDDYDTPDGTCIRDYVHVADLADAHLAALDRLAGGAESFAVNIGQGVGYSVMEILDAARAITGAEIPAKIEPRRSGDSARLYADISRARMLLGFAPRHSGIENIIETAWRFHRKRWNILR